MVEFGVCKLKECGLQLWFNYSARKVMRCLIGHDVSWMGTYWLYQRHFHLKVYNSIPTLSSLFEVLVVLVVEG